MKWAVSISLLLLLACLPISSAAGDSKKPKKTVETKAGYQNNMAMKDLSKLEKLQQAMRQSSTNNTAVSATKQGPCSCGHGLCSCCSRILLNLWRQKACVNVTYDPDEFAFTTKIVMNDRLLYTRTMSGKNPRPICVPVPRVPVVTACIRFYNIYFQGRNVHACVNMEGKFQDTTLFKVGMDCLRLGSNGVALVKPEDGGGLGQIQFLPEDPDDGSSSDDYDGYDDYDDSDEDDNVFDY